MLRSAGIGMVKIKDVAREAGVSPATVSRVLNGSLTVDSILAERVRVVAAALNYHPNAVARGLRTQRTKMWALIISDIGNPFFTTIARGVEDVAHANDYALMLCNSDEDSAKEFEYLRAAVDGQAAGVILSPHGLDTRVDILDAAGVPYVIIDRSLGSPHDTVLVDTEKGAYEAARHLLNSGWNSPACIAGPSYALSAIQRLDGYKRAMREANRPERFVQVDFRIEGGRQGAADLLDSTDPPDALITSNAAITLGALREISSRDLKPGEDIGLVAFDDTPWAEVLRPALSVVAQPAYEIGQTAASLLVQRIGGDKESHRCITLQTELIIRGSSLRTTSMSKTWE